MANETILIVDADPKSQKVLEVSFKKAGYRVEITASPDAAMRAIESAAPDIIVSDTTFDGADGFEFLADLKVEDPTRDIPFVFLTEDRALAQKMRGFELGADDYLTKPVYIKEVTTRIELLLQKRAKGLIGDDEIEEFEGDLEDITMIDLLQAIESEPRSGSLRLVRQNREAVVYFRDGNVLDAICGKLQGEEAIYRLMLWPEGRFVLRYHDHARRVDNIEKDSGALLMEGIRRLEEWNELTVEMPGLGRVFETDYQQLPKLLDELPAEVGRIVRLFDGIRTIRDVIDDSPFNDVTTLKVIAKLLEDSIVLDVTPDDTAQEEGRSNLANWLSDKAPADLSGELPAADDEGKWKIHFDENVDPDEAIRKIEADERRRRDEEARRLAGMDTIRRIPAVDSGKPDPSKTPESSLTEKIDQLMVEERDRRSREAQMLLNSEDDRSTDMGFGHADSKQDDESTGVRENRITERLQEAVSRTKPHGSRVTEEMVDAFEDGQDGSTSEASEVSEVSEASEIGQELTDPQGRNRRPTPLSTPAQLINGEDRTDEVETDEASTRELPPAGTKDTPDEVVTADETRPTLEESAGLDEVSEADAFVDESGELMIRDQPSSERITKDLRAPTQLTPLGADPSEPEVDPADGWESESWGDDETPPDEPGFGFPSEDEAQDGQESERAATDTDEPGYVLEEIPENALFETVERISKDGELVTAVYDLTKSKPAGPPPAYAEQNTVPEPAPDPDPKVQVADDSTEVDFFAQPEEPHDFDTFGEPPTDRGTPKLVLGILALLVAGFIYVIATSGPETDPVEPTDSMVATKDSKEPESEKNDPPTKLPEPAEPTEVDEGAIELDAQVSADGVSDRAFNLAMVHSGQDVLASADAGDEGRSDAGSETQLAVIDKNDKPEVNPTPQPVEPDPNDAQDDPAESADPEPRPDPEPEPKPEPEKAEPVKPSGPSVAEAERLLRREDFGKALTMLRDLSKAKPGDPKVAYLHGQAALSDMKNVEAITHLERAESLGYRSSTLYLDLAAAYTLDGNNPKAKQAYERFLEIKPEGRESDKVRKILETRF